MGASCPCSAQCCVTISADEVGIVEHWAKFHNLQGAGLACFPFPCMCQLAGTLSTRQRSLPLSTEAKTKDNVFIEVKLEVQYVLNKNEAMNAFYKLSNVEQQICSYLKNEIRSTICTRLLDEVYNDRSVLIANVRDRLSEVMAAYGYILVAVLVHEVTPAAKVFQAMNSIETLRRLRVATLDQAEAEKLLVVKRAEGEMERKRLSGVGLSRQRMALLRGMEMSMAHFISDAQETSADPATGVMPRSKTMALDGLEALEADAQAAMHAYARPANRMRMPTDVGVEDTNTLFPPEAISQPPLIGVGQQAEGLVDTVRVRDVMELMLITNYFDMLKDVGQNDSASTIYIGNSPGTVGSMRREIAGAFSG
ncbi:unnamed protein product [Amoebophrya sp. A25]|nr:unnamed protein product [Amoebophrya sp. A25]|eukprot:GSA25T00017911001.1